MLTTVETAPFVKLVKTQHVRSAKLAKLAKLPVAKVPVVRGAKLVKDNATAIAADEERKWHTQLLLKEKQRLHQQMRRK